MLIKNILSFSSASAFGQLLRVVQEFAVRAMLPPDVMGIWNFIIVVRNLGASFDLGITTAARRAIGLFHGAGQSEKVRDYARMTVTLEAMQLGLIGLGIILYGAAFSGTQNGMGIGVYAAAAAILFAGALGNANTQIYQSLAKFTGLSKRLVFYWPIYALLLTGGAYVAGVQGMIISMIAALTFLGLLLHSGLYTQIHAKGRKWSSKAARELVSVGVPLRLVDYPIILFLMTDSLFVSRFFSLELLAIYATAKLVVTQLGQIPSWIGSVLITRILNETGAGEKSRRALGHEFFIYLRFYYLVAAPLMICGAELGVALIVGTFLPDYSGALGVLTVLLFTVYFTPNATVVRNFWSADKRYRPLFITNMVAMTSMAAGLMFLVVTQHYTLHAVAAVFLLSHIIYFVVLIAMIGPELWPVSEIAKLAASLAISICITLLALLAGGRLLQATAVSSLTELITIGGLELAIIAPVVIAGAWWTRAAT